MFQTIRATAERSTATAKDLGRQAQRACVAAAVSTGKWAAADDEGGYSVEIIVVCAIVVVVLAVFRVQIQTIGTTALTSLGTAVQAMFG